MCSYEVQFRVIGMVVYIVKFDVVIDSNMAAAMKSDLNSMLWHRRLAYLNFHSLKKIKDKVPGLGDVPSDCIK